MIGGPAVMETDLPLELFARGKVRDTYKLGPDQLLMVATDRLSAFDHVLPNGIPDRGKVLTQLSIYWFSQTHTFQENHLVSGMMPDLPAELRIDAETDDGVVMAISHRDRPIYGIQFHPESYGTEGGDKLIANFLAEVRQ